MATKKEDPVYVVPGVEDAARLNRGSAMALFVPGVEAYTTAGTPTIQIKGVKSDPITAQFHGAEVGRLFNLANRFMHQSPAVLAAPGLPGGSPTPGIQGMPIFNDLVFFKALSDVNGEAAISPTAPYTVLIFSLDQSVPYPSAGTSA